MLEQPKTMITTTTKMTTKSNLSFVFVVVVDAINAIGLQAS